MIKLKCFVSFFNFMWKIFRWWLFNSEWSVWKNFNLGMKFFFNFIFDGDIEWSDVFNVVIFLKIKI